MKSLNLHKLEAPLRKAAAGKKQTRILLVDNQLAALSSDIAVPALPASFKGQPGQRIELSTDAGRLVIVGCGGVSSEAGEGAMWEVAGAAAIDAMRALRIDSANLGGALMPTGIAPSEAAQRFCVGASLSAYRCTAYRSKPAADHFEIKELGLAAADWQAGESGRELGAAINWTRALVDAPANLLTPQSFAQEIKSLEALGIDVQILDEAALEKLGAGGLLAVGRGAENPPCMVVCRWNGRKAKGIDLGLVGKGLTFDGGGLNIKARPVIEKMKFDMAGAASVVGALRVLALRKAPLNVVAALPLCENAIDGKAYRPGDVITSLSGLTIEVDNTDAEGRIVLADAITHLINAHKPAVLIDVATLTGAIMSALHEEFAGLFTTDEALAATLSDAASSSGEAVWRLPLSKRQDYLVDSDIADVKNVAAPGFMGVGMGSAIGGAKFLERFAGGTRWAHVDIAGTAWTTRPLPGISRGATGYGVRLLDTFATLLLEGGAAK
jgi:leucyl aminopeptidase